MLCCLVAEFMAKLKRRFPVYESFFAQIDEGFKKAGELFLSKIKDSKVIQYHLTRKDIKNRNCLQIMAQNRLYPMLKADSIGEVIDRNWSGPSVMYGLSEISSFTYIMRYNVEEDILKFRDFARLYNRQKRFYFNFYSYRDVPSIRYYFKESYGFLLIILYQILIYMCVIDENLDNTVNTKYYVLSRLIYMLSLGQAFDKINSMVFFTLVPRWYIEMDPFILWLSFAAVTFFHWWDFKNLIIPGNSPEEYKIKELINALLLSYQFAFLWYKILVSLKGTKTYGGFLRTIEIVFKRLFLVIIFLYCFVLLMTGVFNLFFQQTLQFQSYYDAFFFLAQAAQQEYSLGERWNLFVKIALIVFMGACTLVLVNLIIALETMIYDDASEDVLPEHRANLVKLTEYLRWDENYGLFKFLFAPLNIFQLPFSIFTLFPNDKKYWVEKFTRMLFFFVAFLFFIVFFVYETAKLPISFAYFIFVYPFKNGLNLKRFLLYLFVCPFLFVAYYFRDLANFWFYSYREQFEGDDNEDYTPAELVEIKKTFSTLINAVSHRVETDKKCKRFWIPELLNSWLIVISQNSKYVSKKEVMNRMHRRTVIKRKYKDMKNNIWEQDLTIQRRPYTEMYFQAEDQITVSIHEQFKKNFEFLFRFADKEGYIDRDVAKNIFPKKNYYDDDDYKFMFYYNFKYFKNIITHFTKMTNEIKKDMNKLRGVYMDFLKINEKFKRLKIYLKTHKFTQEEINTLAYGVTHINTFFAGLENILDDAQSKELYDKITKQSSDNARRREQTSALQNAQH